MVENKKTLREQLNALKIFPNNTLVKKLRKQIKDKLIKFEQKEKKKEDITAKANQSRSQKLKKYHRYIKLIRNNFPNLQHSQIRKQFSQRRQGKDVSIPDAVWQNPSP